MRTLPVISCATIEKDLRMRPEDCGHNIDPTIIIEIAECGAASRYQRVDSRIDSFEAAIMIHRQRCWLEVVQRRIDGFHVVEHVPLSDEQIFLTVVVEILETDAPT